MKNYTTTEKNYNTINLKRKYELALYGAELIVKDIEGNGIYIADSYLKELYKIHILAVEMLNVTSTKDNTLISESQYNELVESGIFEQIKDIPTIYNDYTTFCEMLNREIENKLIESNDIFKRMDMKIQQEVTPELIEEINKSTADMLKTIEKRNK